MPSPEMPNAFQQTRAGMRWKVSKEAIEDTKRKHASAVARLLLIEFSGILEPFKFRKDRQLKIDWGMRTPTLEVWDKGKETGHWFTDGTNNRSSKVTALHWARPHLLHTALKKVLDILEDLQSTEDDIIISALDGKFIEVNHL